ncbi:MAG: hypothetical protein Q4F95_07300 [Oscillospiraceae bacterium]|nr:hypothetical protein [Oscillospiraceae bacterium]
MVSYEECEHVTYKQIDDMKHAIGFDNRKVRGTKNRRYEPYRNYFDAGERDIEDLDKLVKIGLMTKRKFHNNTVYHVTEDGKTFLYYVTGVEILPDMK